jgi:hypothetical protein
MDFNEKSRESAFCRDVFAPKKVKSTSDSGKLHVKSGILLRKYENLRRLLFQGYVKNLKL